MRYNNVVQSLKLWQEVAPKVDALTEKLNLKHASEEIEGWPMRKSVILNKPVRYVIGKHLEDEEVENVEIMGEPQVDVRVFVEKTEYLESNPTG